MRSCQFAPIRSYVFAFMSWKPHQHAGIKNLDTRWKCLALFFMYIKIHSHNLLTSLSVKMEQIQPQFCTLNMSPPCVPVGKASSKSKEDAPYELESQFVLRLPSVRYFCVFPPSPRNAIMLVQTINVSLSFAGVCLNSATDRPV